MTSDAVAILQKDLGQKMGDPEWSDYKVKAKVAMDIYEMRTRAGSQLAVATP